MLHSKWPLRLAEVIKLLCTIVLVTVFVCPVAIDANCTISGNTKFAPAIIQNAGYNFCREPPLARRCSTTKRYYSWDGSCVNLKHPHWGQARTSYTRLLKPDYVPSTSLPRKSVNGGNLPLARVISTTIFTDKNVQSNQYNIFFYGFGQFIDHDITLSAPKVDNNVTCCNGFNNTVKNPDPNNCMATIIPPNDPDYGKFGVTCIEARRTITTQGTCAIKPPRPVNQAAAPLDLSILYGDNQGTFNSLRSGVGGKLLVSPNVTESNGLNFPPVKSNCPFGGIDPVPGGRCFATGEFRVQQNPEIMINTITFLRMHNFIAEGLANECPSCTDEALFQEARKLLCALYQNIVYSEYIPPLLGETLYTERKLKPETSPSEYAAGADENVNVQAITEYAASVGRVSHSMIKSLVNYPSSSGTQSYSLPTKFFNQAFFLNGDTCSDLASGYAATSAMEEDQFVTKAVSFKLFLSVTRLFGQDLISVDINRGRDQGVATYVQVRDACGLCPVNTFDDLAPLISNPTTNIPTLKALYNNTLADADLYVIGALEVPVDKLAIVGPTLSCVFAEQFHRSMYGDRLFYSFKSAGFSIDQLKYIQNFTYAQLLCLTQNINSIQPSALKLPTSSNPVTPCSQLISSFNFSLFPVPPNFVSQPSTLPPKSAPTVALAAQSTPAGSTSSTPPPPPPPPSRSSPSFGGFDPQNPLAGFGFPSM